MIPIKKLTAIFLFAFISINTKADLTNSQKPIFDPNNVTGLQWSSHDKTISFHKQGEKWLNEKNKTLSEDATWAIVRRLAILSKSEIGTDLLKAESQGHFSLKIKNESWGGSYSNSTYQWDSGPQKGKGLDFSKNQDLKEIFGEGTLAFQPHEINLCNASKITQVDFKLDWTLTKKVKKWTIEKDKDQGPARRNAVESFLNRLCHFKVDLFVADAEKNGETVDLKIHESKKQMSVSEVNKIYFIDKTSPFKSKDLDDILSVNIDELRDSSIEEGRVALDPSATTQKRIAAIRKIKELRSTEGIPALKTLVFEKTDLDVYRYEAVDALVAIGTKEAYKIIADRLAQVGRSGFELRMARALSSAMGRNFTSDENTPEDIRRPEVNALLEAYKKNPPGK